MPSKAERFGIPEPQFLWHLDQIAHMLSTRDVDRFLHYQGRTPGLPPRDKLLAVNIAPRGQDPEWRVHQRELIRWMTAIGFPGVRRADQPSNAARQKTTGRRRNVAD